VFIDHLHRNFKITTLEFPQMQIEQRQDGIFVCHRVNAGKVLERFKMHESNPVVTPCDHSSGGPEASVGRVDLCYRLLTPYYIM